MPQADLDPPFAFQILGELYYANLWLSRENDRIVALVRAQGVGDDGEPDPDNPVDLGRTLPE